MIRSRSEYIIIGCMCASQTNSTDELFNFVLKIPSNSLSTVSYTHLLPFNSIIAILLENDHPSTPLVNAGAISACSMVQPIGCLLYTSLAALTITACSSGPKFQVNGDVSGADGKMLYLEASGLEGIVPLD